MELGIRGRTAIVCGASQGMGLAIAEALAPGGGDGGALERRREAGSPSERLLLSAIRLTNLCLPLLRASGRGRVITIASTSVKEPIPMLALSNAIRPGVVGWVKTRAGAGGPHGGPANGRAP